MTAQRLLHHEITDKLGEGGMGVVYKARDTRLDLSVAVEVLPEHIAKREEDRQRFEREAHTISSLNGPNICAVLPRPAIHVVPNWTAGLAR